MIALQDESGLLFRCIGEMAALVPDGFGRWRVSLQDGGVAHIPGERPAGPWVALGDAWVLPELLTLRGEHWVDPAGFTYAYQPLEPTGWVDPDPGPAITLCSQGTGSILHTSAGDHSSPLTAAQKSKEYPNLVLVSRGNYCNPERLRRIERDLTRHRLVFDDGSSLMVSHKFHHKAAERLGLPHFMYLEPYLPGPCELGPLRIIAYVDYDTAGWIIVRSFLEQLSRYGIQCPWGIHGYLIRPEHFSAEELELHALPLPADSPATITKNKLWMLETNGINGEEKGITANRLDPVERVAAVLKHLLGSLASPGTS